MSDQPGRSVAIVGIDGVGKSTVVAGVRAVVPEVRVIKVSIHGTRSPGRRRSAWLRSTIRGIRVLIGARRAIRRGEVVLWDRHPLEDRVTGRHGRRVLGRRRGWLIRLAPLIDTLIVLDAPIDHVLERRPNEDAQRSEAMRAAYLQLAGTMPSVIIDARQSREVVLDEVLKVLDRWTPAREEAPAAFEG
jgi:thymidylate kinase